LAVQPTNELHNGTGYDLLVWDRTAALGQGGVESRYGGTDVDFVVFDGDPLIPVGKPSMEASVQPDTAYPTDFSEPWSNYEFYAQYSLGGDGFDSSDGNTQTIDFAMYYYDLAAVRRVWLLGGVGTTLQASPHSNEQKGSAYVFAPSTTTRIQSRFDAIAHVDWYPDYATTPTTFKPPTSGWYDIVVIQEHGTALGLAGPATAFDGLKKQAQHSLDFIIANKYTASVAHSRDGYLISSTNDVSLEVTLAEQSVVGIANFPRFSSQ
jgi:hypothetical protein